MNYLISIANKFMSFGRLAADGHDFETDFPFIKEITDAINVILGPLLIVVGAAGTIYAVVLGVNMARADSTEKREEAKKRLINVLIGVAITIGLILFFQLLTRSPDGILYKMLKWNE